MLDYLRQRSQNVVIVFFVAIICAVFIINFGPQAQGCSYQRSVWLAKVYGKTITLNDFNWVERLVRSRYRLPREYIEGGRFATDVIDGLIEREIFAHYARSAGLAVGDDDISSAVTKRGEVYFSWPAGSFIPLRGPVQGGFFDEEGLYKEEDFHDFLAGLQLSDRAYAEQQEAELLAERVRGIVEMSVQISEEELWTDYASKADRVNLQYVRVYPQFFRDALRPTEAELQAWAAEHADDIQKRYDADRFRYTNVRKQVRVQDILIRVEEGADEEQLAARRARAEAILALAKAPDADLGLLARCFSDDPQGSARSGDLGYLRKGMSRFGSEFDDPVFELAPGTLSDLIQTKRGFHIVKVVDQREGDVTIDQARLEIAEDLYRKARGDARAREVIDAVLARVRDGAEMDDSLLEGIPELQLEQCPALPGVETPEGAEEEPQRRALAPVIRETGFFNRSGLGVPGIGESSELTDTAFSLTEEHPVADDVIQVRDDLFVVKLAEDGRQAPTREEFESERASIESRLLRRKRQEALRIFALRLRRQAESEGEVRRNEDGIRSVTRASEEGEPRGEGEGDGEGQGGGGGEPSAPAPSGGGGEEGGGE